MNLLEKKRERERSKAEAIEEDITFKTKMGVSVCLCVRACSNMLYTPLL